MFSSKSKERMHAKFLNKMSNQPYKSRISSRSRNPSEKCQHQLFSTRTKTNSELLSLDGFETSNLNNHQIEKMARTARKPLDSGEYTLTNTKFQNFNGT